MDLIKYADFAKLDLRIAQIKNAEAVEGTDKLIKLTLDVGELGEKMIISGIKPWYEPETLVGKNIVYLANLETKIIKGVASQGMLLAAESNDEIQCVLLAPDQEIAPGSKIH